MVLGDIFERFIQQSPVTVMTRAALEHALAPEAIDACSSGPPSGSTPGRCCSPRSWT